jgi:hypothetical protein
LRHPTTKAKEVAGCQLCYPSKKIPPYGGTDDYKIIGNLLREIAPEAETRLATAGTGIIENTIVRSFDTNTTLTTRGRVFDRDDNTAADSCLLFAGNRRSELLHFFHTVMLFSYKKQQKIFSVRKKHPACVHTGLNCRALYRYARAAMIIYSSGKIKINATYVRGKYIHGFA